MDAICPLSSHVRNLIRQVRHILTALSILFTLFTVFIMLSCKNQASQRYYQLLLLLVVRTRNFERPLHSALFPTARLRNMRDDKTIVPDSHSKWNCKSPRKEIHKRPNRGCRLWARKQQKCPNLLRGFLSYENFHFLFCDHEGGSWSRFWRGWKKFTERNLEATHSWF